MADIQHADASGYCDCPRIVLGVEQKFCASSWLETCTPGIALMPHDNYKVSLR
jgi:hypothetical protein